MKFVIATIFIYATLANIVIGMRVGLPAPPRANDLTDHFGSNPSANLYGPVPPVLGVGGDLMRQGMNSGIPLTPIKNFAQEVVPADVVAGNFLNTAPDASKIIKPNLAGKLIIINS